MNRVYVISGGTVVHVRPHFALAAPAYGSVGDHIAETLAFPLSTRGYEVVPLFTRMAEAQYDSWPSEVVSTAFEVLDEAGLEHLETNDDLRKLVDYLVAQPTTRCIVMAAAVCDWEPTSILWSNSREGTFKVGKSEARLKTSEGDIEVQLTPADKILDRIRAGANGRKDVFLVSFKATTGLIREETYAAGLKALKGSSSNLVLANDVQNKHNVVVTPEEFPYYGEDRDDAIHTLCEMIEARLELDFVRTKVVEGDRADLRALHEEGAIPPNFLPVLEHLIKRGAYKPLPWKDSTSGHFGCVVDGKDFVRVSSVRKANHNRCLEEGVAKILPSVGDTIVAQGARPSVGEHTQRAIYEHLREVELPTVRTTEAHSIVHFHCDLRPASERQFVITTAPQKPFECGSVQCGENTATHMGMGEVGVWSVHLEGHGPNIAFHREVEPERVIAFIERHWDLDGKSGGMLVAPR